METPGAVLRRLRVARGLSLNELARLTHYTKGYLSKVETGEKALSVGVARACDAALQTGAKLTDLAEALAPPGGGCPYRGLRPYEPEDARWFFGRDRAVSALLTRLAGPPRGPLIVVAPSGAGKTSLLRAGLLPALRRGTLPTPGSRTWPVIVLTPGEHPVAALLTRIGTLIGHTPGEDPGQDPGIDPAGGPGADLADGPAAGPAVSPAEGPAEDLAGDPAVLTRWIADAFNDPTCTAAARRLVLIVDQLEEIFTLCSDETERRTFLSAIDALAAAGALVILGLRADFYGHCLSHPTLLTALREAQLPLGPMNVAELRTAITGPAHKAGLTVEPALVELLLRDMGLPPTIDEHDSVHEPGTLPLLSHALLTTWQHRTGDTLTVTGYRKTGGIAGAVAATAEQVYTALDPTAQDIARRLLLHMVCVEDSGAETRRPIDISTLPPAHFPPGPTSQVIDAFTTARLLTLTDDSARLAHEALLRAWPRLREWIHADRAGLRTHRRLAETASAWDREARDPSLLYRGTRLQTVLDWAAANPAALTTTEQEFLEACQAAQAAEQATARRHARLRRQAVAGLAVLLVAALVSTVFAVNAARTAEQRLVLAQKEKNLNLSHSLAVQSESLLDRDSTVAQLLAVAAHRVAPTAAARRAMLNALAHPARGELIGHTESVVRSVFSPDGRLLASAGFDGTLRLWDVATHRQTGQLTSHQHGLHTTDFSPDGRLLVTAGAAGTVRLWDVTTRRQVAELVGHRGPVHATDFSPDGRLLATAGFDGTLRLWDVADHRQAGELTGHRDAVYAADFSPDGRLLVTGGADKTVRLWNVATRRQVGGPLARHDHAVPEVDFSPDGRLIAVAADDDTVRLWDPATRRPAGAPLTGRPDHRIDTVAFSPDGRTLVGGGRGGGGALLAWDVATRHEIGTPLLGHADWVADVEFSPDGRLLASSSSHGDNTVRLWDMATHRPLDPPVDPEAGPVDPEAGPVDPEAGPVQAVAFSPDGRVLATGVTDQDEQHGAVRLWDARTRRPLGPPLTGHLSPVTELRFNPDGRTLVSTDTAAPVRLWDVRTRRPAPVPKEAYGNEAAFSPDGRLLATADTGIAQGYERAQIPNVQLWDVATRRPLGAPLLDRTQGLVDLEFSPDGRILAVASERTFDAETGITRNQVQFYDVATRRPAGAPLIGHTGALTDIEFAPGGHVLASAGTDKMVRLWDVATRRQIGVPLSGHDEEVTDVAFAPDGRLASADVGGTIRLWDVATHRPIGAALTASGLALRTLAFSPDSRTLAAAGDDGGIRLWDVALPTDPAETLCAMSGRARPQLTPAEWRQYLPHEPIRPICPARSTTSK
ncbi:helix-turn-helix domain-containing protein [Nonomuraea sp. NPDC049421]|uniref:nSTAND1 domain-containing NTPase n=1 Tax=Nonomuraea sp. NPDC049421 TaxID=3155275 RepID=UPI003449E442